MLIDLPKCSISSARMQLVCCFTARTKQTAQAVATRADERGDRSSHYARTDFLALLDRLGSEYDWIRPAVAEPVAKVKKHSKLRKHSKTQQG